MTMQGMGEGRDSGAADSISPTSAAWEASESLTRHKIHAKAQSRRVNPQNRRMGAMERRAVVDMGDLRDFLEQCMQMGAGLFHDQIYKRVVSL
jgi:hypothetical protein